MNPMMITYDSTNYYLLPIERGWLMIDTGWAGTFHKLTHLFLQKDIRVNEIKFLVITHFHPDHAGLVQDMKNCGARLLLHECQVSFPEELKKYFKPQHNFREIDMSDNLVLTSTGSRIFLEKLGIKGEIIPTPGHSDDSISLVINRCCAFTGDLHPLWMVDADSNPAYKTSWDLISKYEVENIYPAHGNPFRLK